MKTILLLSLFTMLLSDFKQSENILGIKGSYLCENQLQLEELRISENEFVLFHHSHIDGTYRRNGKVKFSGDTINLMEDSNTIKSNSNLLEFHSRFIYKKEHLFVIFNDRRGKEYIQKSKWNYTKTSSIYNSTGKPSWYME